MSASEQAKKINALKIERTKQNKAVKAAPEAAVAWVEGGSSSSPLPWEIRPMLSVKSD